MARIYPYNASAELHSVPTKSVKNTKPTTIKSCRFFYYIVDALSYFVRYVCRYELETRTSWSAATTNINNYRTITPSTNNIGTSSVAFSLRVFFLKMNFLSYKVFPIKKVTINSLLSTSTLFSIISIFTTETEGT